MLLLIAAQQVFVVPGDSLLSSAVHDALHMPWFFVLTWLLQLWFRSWQQTISVAVLFALTTEGFQTFTGREPSLADLGRNLLGGTSAWLVWHGIYHRRRRITHLCLALFICVAVTSPVAFVLLSRDYALAQFPLLLDPNDARGRAFARATAPSRASELGIHITVNDAAWPGLHLTEPVADWSRFSHLNVAVSVDSGPSVDLFVGLLLKPGDGITNFSVHKLQSEEQVVRVPLLSLLPSPHSPVYDVFLYTSNEYQGRELVYHQVWLD